jgi:hypothetical protein
VAPPLQLGVVGPYPVWCVWFPICLLLEETGPIQNFVVYPVTHGTQGFTPIKAPEPSVERVAGVGQLTVGRTSSHMVLQAVPWDSVAR